MPPEARAEPTAHLVIESDPLAVRDALRRLLGAPPLADLADDARGSAEIVLAEVLNNVVEHAYACSHGTIEVWVRPSPSGITCRVSDRGLPLPGNRLPAGTLRCLAGDDLPEGGFGWHMIRALACDLDYRRIDGVNHLSFRLRGAERP